MGLRCLLGHDFGPPGVVREHEEDGNEMVVTEREIQLCQRCGEEQVLSESTEVRAIRSEAEMGLHGDDVEAVTPASETESSIDADDASMVTETTDAEAEPVTTSESTDADVEEPDTGGRGSADAGEFAEVTEHGSADAGEPDDTEPDTSLIERAEAGFDDSPAPGEEDAVILDEESEKTERGHGEWPDSSDVGEPSEADADADAAAEADDEEDAAERTIAETAAEEDAELLDETDGTADAEAADETAAEAERVDGAATDTSAADQGQGAWPDHDGADEGFAADAASSGGPDVSFGNSLTPQSTNGEHIGRETETGTEEYETSYPGMAVEERDGDGTIVSARGDTPARGSTGETEYYCPNCDHSRPLGSSLRKGDICPECQRGYIAERER